MTDREPTRLNVDLAQVRELAELLDTTGLTEIEVHDGERAVRVARQVVASPAAAMAAPAQALGPAAGPAAEPAPDSRSADLSNHPGLVRAPLVGTVYLAPEPGARPFAPEGAEVAEGDTLLIIEAMKVMNPILAPKGGRVARLLVANEAPVEYDQPLLVIE